MQPPNPEAVKHHFAGVFLVTEMGRVVGQQRDNIPTIDNPGKVGAFGGTVEAGEDPLTAVWRELVQEETNLQINKENFVHLNNDVAWRKLTGEWEVRHFYYVRITERQLASMEVYEGQGWAPISGPKDSKLIDGWQPIVHMLFDRLQIQY